MKKLFIYCLMSLSLQACSQSSNAPNKISQNDRNVGGRCEGCEAVYESPVAFEQLNSTDTSEAFEKAGLKIKYSGIVFENDGRTPATGVVLYYYHTNEKGVYPTRGNEQGWAKRHGYLRGWVKTDKDGRYSFYTIRPGSYPNSRAPAHIHVIVKESGKTPYYIDDFLFAEDPFLEGETPNARPRGGNGVVNVKHADGNISSVNRNIILGENIPDYK